MKLALPRGETSVVSFAEMMSESLTESELRLIRQPSTKPTDQSADEIVLDHLLRLWTLKECLVKAMGVGLSMELGSIEFASLPPPHPSTPTCSALTRLRLSPQANFGVTVASETLDEWLFWSVDLHLLRNEVDRCDSPSMHPPVDRYVLSAAARLASGIELDQLSHEVEFKTVWALVDGLSDECS